VVVPHRIDVSTRVEKTHRVTLTDEDIGDILSQKYGIILPDEATDIRMFVQVPGGGDWSNQDLDIDEDTPVQIVWKTVEDDEMFPHGTWQQLGSRARKRCGGVKNSEGKRQDRDCHKKGDLI